MVESKLEALVLRLEAAVARQEALIAAGGSAAGASSEAAGPSAVGLAADYAAAVGPKIDELKAKTAAYG